MDPKVIEMNNLRVLNDYLNQTLDVLVRGQRLGNGHAPGVGYSPFAQAAGFSPFSQAAGYSPFSPAVGYSPFSPAVGYSPFSPSYSPFAAPIPGAAGGIGTDVVYGPSAYGYSPFAATNPFTGLPLMGTTYSPFSAWQQTPWAAGQTPWTANQTPWTAGQTPWTPGQTPWTAGQTPWTPGQTPWAAGAIDPARQAQLTHALAAKQSVLEAMCRMVGIPV